MVRKEIMNCKNCGSKNSNGTNFCTKKCRKEYCKQYEVKGAKKRAIIGYERALSGFGSNFSNENDCQNSY